jgi:hypothetical protein
MSYSYDRRASMLVPPNKLLGHMNQSVDKLLSARIEVRKLHLALGEVRRDASGSMYTDNYDNPEIEKVEKDLYELDRTIGEAFRYIERLERDFKSKWIVRSFG